MYKFVTVARNTVSDTSPMPMYIYQNEKTPMDVFNELVLQVMLRQEMKDNWPVPKK